MPPPENELNIAEIYYDTGKLRFRYGRYFAEDGSKWVRHGLFQAFHPNGQLASEGNYENGLEEGLWRDYHSNGQLAAEGRYRAGKEHGTWRYRDEEGKPERDVRHVNGREIEVIERHRRAPGETGTE